MSVTPQPQELISTNPTHPDQILGKVTIASQADIQKAITATRAVQPVWRALGPAGRAAELRKLYSYIFANRTRFEELETREMGRPIMESRGTFDWGFAQFAWNLDHAEGVLAPTTTYEDEKSLHQTVYEPYGVVGSIAPWNFPFSNWIMGALQPLLAGNAVVYKPSEEVPLSAQAIADAWVQAGLPRDVFCIVHGGGEVGEMLARAFVDFIDFTGSFRTGQHIYKIAAERFVPVRLELGGSDAGIVFDDCDIDAILEPIFWAKFVNCGQICCGLKRLFVQRKAFPAVAEKLVAFVRAQKIGDPMNADTLIGPLVAKRQRDLLCEQVDDARAKGAKVLCGGATLPNTEGYYYKPTVLTDVVPAMRAYHEELFGPVLPLWSFDTEEEAVQLANATPYGLSAHVFTDDRQRFQRIASQLQAGSVSHNGLDYGHPANPFGGYKFSGIGRVCGAVGLRQSSQIKTVSQRKE